MVEVESKNIWEWLLANLVLSFTSEVHPLAFILNIKKSLSKDIKVVFLNVEQRVFIRHLWKKLKNFFYYHDSYKLKILVWITTNTYINMSLKKKEERFNISPRIHFYLMSLPYKWSKSKFLVNIKIIIIQITWKKYFNLWIREVWRKHVDF